MNAYEGREISTPAPYFNWDISGNLKRRQERDP
jgi:hypothetical protein